MRSLTAAIIALATRDGRYGYRRITALLPATAGWTVNVEAGGPDLAAGRPEGAAAAAQAGSACGSLTGPVPGSGPRRPNHVWAYDFLTDRTHDGRAFRLLTIVDAFTRECLAIVVARKLTADDVLAPLTDLFIARGCPSRAECGRPWL